MQLHLQLSNNGAPFPPAGGEGPEMGAEDHLGNVRVVLTTNPNQHYLSQVTDYYPFGMEIPVSGNSDNQLKYNGKELQMEAKLEWYDYGARFYDPAIGRTSTMDPHAENYYSMSPYGMFANNPILFVDPDGKDIFISHENERYKYSNGNVYRSVEGNWEQVQAQEGSYLASIQESLNTLASQEDGESLISFFTGDENHIQIRQRLEDEEGSGNRLSGWSVVTDKYPEGGIIPTEAGLQKSPLFVAVGHEMAHRKDIIKGTFDGNEWFTTSDGTTIPNAEVFATHYENMIRAEHDLPLRTHYARDSRKGVGPEIIQSGQSRFYNQYGRPFDYRNRVARREFIRTL